MASLAAPAQASRIAPAVVALLSWGCGHPASRQECEEIFALSVDIKLRELKVTEPDAVAERTAEARALLAKDIDECVGRRISDEAMQCVRGAQSAEAFDACLSW